MSQLPNLGRTLMLFGAVLFLAGAFLTIVPKLPFNIGRLPGDIYVDKPGFKFYFPLTTSILASAILSLLFRLFRKQ